MYKSVLSWNAKLQNAVIFPSLHGQVKNTVHSFCQNIFIQVIIIIIQSGSNTHSIDGRESLLPWGLNLGETSSYDPPTSSSTASPNRTKQSASQKTPGCESLTVPESRAGQSESILLYLTCPHCTDLHVKGMW